MFFSEIKVLALISCEFPSSDNSFDSTLWPRSLIMLEIRAGKGIVGTSCAFMDNLVAVNEES